MSLVFTKLRNRQSFLNRQIVDEINGRLEETPMECIPEDVREFFESDEDGIFIKEEFCNNYEV